MQDELFNFQHCLSNLFKFLQCQLYYGIVIPILIVFDSFGISGIANSKKFAPY